MSKRSQGDERPVVRPSTTRVRAAWLALLAASALIVASCGGDDDGEETDDASTSEETDDSSETDETEDTSESEETPADVEGKVTDFAGYVGGSGPADDSLDPVKIGYVNQQGGAIEVTALNVEGVQIAAEFINTEAGGIGGRPVEIVTCYIANTEEEGQQCGQQFANDDEIVAVVTGPTVVGTESFYAALGGTKPVISGVSVNPTDTVQENAAVLYGGAAYVLAPFGTYAAEVLDVESAALIYPEGSGQDDAAAGQRSGLEAAGIPVEVVAFDPDEPDLTVPLIAAGAEDADLVLPVLDQGLCVRVAEAQRDLGIPDEKVLTSPVCLTPAVIEGLGDFPQWTYAVASSLGIDPSDPSVPPYIEILEAQGQADYVPDPWVLVGFGQMMTLAKWMNAVGGDLAAEDIIAEMKAFEGPMILGSPVLDCGKYEEAPGVCNDHTQFFKYNGAEEGFAPGSGYYGPPEGWEAPGS
jgi:branched-chain amino acid transport system substrate-binding protein